ncbi:nitroreductase family deazaflavin-dependent oxidoreductase [Mycobacteroides abscessus subsp. abscessus]|nr:nitroreductase family deazaflavin-dependent oxidoreductase [Mycobacteroides abscessus]MBN7548407.1 nitroreductase family deazaflavin-dependent oxidoreductase [Mycobacteroides abscessus subsp. abscessus]MDM2692269.1 nitroreductase family deazaflavin-dependent oxidoreductase [Mycobacteroides abscessus]MDM2697081.1 nitroreductase family deazaflavin-dependent oxidoreductase [Mycobacteroides abscessus]MDM2702195.1 nitroreductase family deazaflavin-dependent oxidoreductase [Mycobacteroides abscess
MRAPRGLARFNRYVTNPLAKLFAGWAPLWGIIEHVGRSSGKVYRTPLTVFGIDTGYVILVGYGLESNWIKNVRSAGTAVMHRHGRAVIVNNPQIVSKAQAQEWIKPSSRLFYRLFPFDEAALVLTRES